MRHVAAYLLAVLGGNESPSAKDVKAILSSVGVEEDSKNLDIVIAQLKGKNIEELLAEGEKLLATMPSGGGGGAAAPAAAASGGDAPAAAAGKKAPEPEPEESDDDMGMGLFD